MSPEENRNLRNYKSLCAVAYGMACVYRKLRGDAFATASEFSAMAKDHYQAYEVVQTDLIDATGWKLARGGWVVNAHNGQPLDFEI